MPLPKPKSDQTGYVFSDPQDGILIIGKDSSGRPRQIELSSQALSALRLFADGGFELRSNPSATKKDNIFSQSKEGLAIHSSAIGETPGIGINISASGDITLEGRSIILRANGSDGITIDSQSQITVSAGDNIKIEGSNVGVAARNKMLIASKGLLNIRGNGGVIITEPKEKLIPTSFSDIIKKAFQFMFPEYF